MCADCAGADWQMGLAPKGGHGLGWLEGNWGGFGATQAPMRVVCGLGGEKAGMFASEN